jgi:hypothetical protein
MEEAKFLRRKEAGAYLQRTFGFCTAKSLAHYAARGGGPAYRKAGGVVVYTREDLDAWAQAKIGQPAVTAAGHRAMATEHDAP